MVKETKKYRKKPVIVEAYQTDKVMYINTLEGVHKAEPGDYIITGIKGEQYPCKPDIFEATYELVDHEIKEGDYVRSKMCKNLSGKVIKLMGDNDAIILCRGKEIYADLSGWSVYDMGEV